MLQWQMTAFSKTSWLFTDTVFLPHIALMAALCAPMHTVLDMECVLTKDNISETVHNHVHTDEQSKKFYPSVNQ